jgi:site-specific recombinase XerD
MNDLALPHASTPAVVAHGLGAVADDWQAIDVWLQLLDARQVSAETLRAYQAQVRRLRWYCETHAAPTPRGWSYQDVLAYLAFLEKEAGSYICPRGLRPGQPGWTPFRGKQSGSSIAETRKAIRALFSFWQAAGYIPRDPWAMVGAGARNTGDKPSRFAIPATILDLVTATMDAAPRNRARDHLLYHRDTFTLALLRGTGLRAHEAAAADMADIGPSSDPETGTLRWVLRVKTQKGGGQRDALLGRDVVLALQRYRLAFDLEPMPVPGESYGLILSPLTERSAGGVNARARRHNAKWRAIRTRQGIYNIVKDRFAAAAAAARDAGDHAAAGLLCLASTHWLRHTRAMEVLLKTNNTRLTAEALGHADIRTTMAYTQFGVIELARALDE